MAEHSAMASPECASGAVVGHFRQQEVERLLRCRCSVPMLQLVGCIHVCAQKPKLPDTTKMVVRNVAFEAIRKDIMGLFTPFGHIKSCRLPRKFDGTHRCALCEVREGLCGVGLVV